VNPLATSTPLDWIHLGGLFCAELGAGTLAALAFVYPAPVGPPFYRLMGGMAAIPLALGAWLLLAAGSPGPAAMVGIALLAIPAFAIPTKGRGRWWGLGGAIAASFGAVAWDVADTLDASLGLRSLGIASALASGLLIGAIGTAMSLGHAYLTYPNLKIGHLVRVNRVCGAVIVAKALAVVAILGIFANRFEPLQSAVSTMGGWFGLFTRFAVGLAMPLLFVFMVASSLRYQNTRSATGILYASTVLVLIGEAVAMSLRGQAGGVPL
jgi:hypothetical protein